MAIRIQDTLVSNTKDKILAKTDNIYDETQKKMQSDINKDLYEKVKDSEGTSIKLGTALGTDINGRIGVDYDIYSFCEVGSSLSLNKTYVHEDVVFLGTSEGVYGDSHIPTLFSIGSGLQLEADRSSGGRPRISIRQGGGLDFDNSTGSLRVQTGKGLQIDSYNSVALDLGSHLGFLGNSLVVKYGDGLAVDKNGKLHVYMEECLTADAGGRVSLRLGTGLSKESGYLTIRIDQSKGLSAKDGTVFVNVGSSLTYSAEGKVGVKVGSCLDIFDGGIGLYYDEDYFRSDDNRLTFSSAVRNKLANIGTGLRATTSEIERYFVSSTSIGKYREGTNEDGIYFGVKIGSTEDLAYKGGLEEVPSGIRVKLGTCLKFDQGAVAVDIDALKKALGLTA